MSRRGIVALLAGLALAGLLFAASGLIAYRIGWSRGRAAAGAGDALRVPEGNEGRWEFRLRPGPRGEWRVPRGNLPDLPALPNLPELPDLPEARRPFDLRPWQDDRPPLPFGWPGRSVTRPWTARRVLGLGALFCLPVLLLAGAVVALLVRLTRRHGQRDVHHRGSEPPADAAPPQAQG